MKKSLTQRDLQENALYNVVYAVHIQLTWTHLHSIMFIEDELKRFFYMEMTRFAEKLHKAIAIAKENVGSRGK